MIASMVDIAWSKAAFGVKGRRWASHSRADIQWVKTYRATVRMRVAGDGPSLVMACDPPSTIEAYDEIFDLLSQRFRVYLIEQPGFGFSVPDFGFDFSFEMTNHWLESLLAAIARPPYVLALPCVIGVSAATIARRHPDAVTHLVLNQTPGWQDLQRWALKRDAKGLLRRPVLGQLALQALKRRRVGLWYDTVMANSDLAQRLTTCTRHAFKQGGCFCLATGFQAYLFRSTPTLEPAPQPTLVIWGGADASHQETDHTTSAQLAQHRHTLFWSDAGHSPELEKPAAFSAALAEFYQEHAQSRLYAI